MTIDIDHDNDRDRDDHLKARDKDHAGPDGADTPEQLEPHKDAAIENAWIGHTGTDLDR